MTLFTRVIWVVRMGKMLFLYKPSNNGPEAENKITDLFQPSLQVPPCRHGLSWHRPNSVWQEDRMDPEIFNSSSNVQYLWGSPRPLEYFPSESQLILISPRQIAVSCKSQKTLLGFCIKNWNKVMQRVIWLLSLNVYILYHILNIILYLYVYFIKLDVKENRVAYYLSSGHESRQQHQCQRR